LASVNWIDVVAEECEVPANVTDQDVPLGMPLSVNVTVYSPAGSAVKVIGTDCAAPATFTDPDAGFAVYPVTLPTVYAYVPFASVNAMVLVVEDSAFPARVTDHEVPDGRPDSEKVTAYVAADVDENAIVCVTSAPLTDTLPEAGLAV
jgi:hypothetical protein